MGLGPIRQYISDMTGFDHGERFTSPKEVVEYFMPSSQREMFGDDALTDGEVLAFMCYMVLENEWHCAYRKEEDYI